MLPAPNRSHAMTTLTTPTLPRFNVAIKYRGTTTVEQVRANSHSDAYEQAVAIALDRVREMSAAEVHYVNSWNIDR
jgi:hypothetical protein